MRGLLLFGRLLAGRAAIVDTAPRSHQGHRLSVDVVFNRETGEFRVIANMSEGTALDVQADLDRIQSMRLGSHELSTALSSLLSYPGAQQ